MAVSLADALQHSSLPGNDHAVVDGQAQETSAQQSRVRADLPGVNLNQADLERANLAGAKVTGEQLAQARSLRGATLPDGTKHE